MRKQPISLKTYLAFARSGAVVGPARVRADRPVGALIWAHADSVERARALGSLCARITQQRQGVATLMTGAPCDVSLSDTLPDDTPSEAESFVTHWSPDICLWSGQSLRPALLHTAASANCRLALVGTPDAPFTTPAPRWLPDVAAPTLQAFDVIFTDGEPSEKRLARLGVTRQQMRRSGPLTEATLALDCSPTLHANMAETLAGRPVWLAARVRAGEVGLILRAHRSASRLAHRLLLILVPADPAESDIICDETMQSGFRVTHWDKGDMPDENAQVMLASGPEDLGLWYRLAPLSFIGGSLISGHGGHDPLEAAALGSAVLYGPNIGAHLTAYKRLVDAGAARIVRDVDSLSSAVSQLIAPDQAAAMAHAGWDVVSAGAEMTDLVVEQALDWLDLAGAS